MNSPVPWIGGALVVLGVLWAGQGIGWIGGSPMTGEPFWLVVGLVLVVAGAGLVSYGVRRRPR